MNLHLRKWIAVAAFAAWTAAPSAAFAATYDVDIAHTTVSFKVRHLFSKTQGFFRKFEGVIEYEPGKPESWAASGVIDAASIDTNVEGRDKHLRSPDFFETDKYPTILFRTTGVVSSTETSAKVRGLLTLRGVEKPVELDVQILGVGPDPWGSVRSGFTATTTINRKDFGLTWNKAVETGQLMVGEEVEITLEIEGILRKPS